MSTSFEGEQGPVAGWLALTLAFDTSATLVSFLRESQYSPQAIASLVNDYLSSPRDHKKQSPLIKALEARKTAEQLSLMHSHKIAGGIRQALDWQAQQKHHQLLCMSDERYPALLLSTTDAPPLLYAKGNPDCLSGPTLAVVGSRKASASALRHTRHLAAELAERGLTIVSGLARGIDAAAHEGALEANGRTVAVMATEPDAIYPKQHTGLAQRILDNDGLLLTEFPIGRPTLRWYFPRRNRIISGLCNGVLLTEAALRSGSLTTAVHALNQGREVMAVPGAVSNPNARGCNALIKDGAALVESSQDILDVLANILTMEPLSDDAPGEQLTTGTAVNPTSASNTGDTAATGDSEPDLHAEILELLRLEPGTVDELARHICSGPESPDTAELVAAIGLLEINGRISSDGAGRYSRAT